MTGFEEIYCLNTVIVKDPTIKNLPIYQYYSLMYKQLQFSITAFIYDCLKDITQYVPYSENEYHFVGNGLDVDFNITPIPESQNDKIYVGVYNDETYIYEQVYDYVYNKETNILTFKNAPVKDSQVLIAFYNIGNFNVDLDVDEKVILAEGINIPFLERYQNNIRSLNQIVYTNSYKVHSQAEQLKQLSNLSVIQWRDRVDDLIKKYSYRKPKDGMKNLASRARRNGY